MIGRHSFLMRIQSKIQISILQYKLRQILMPNY